MNVRAVEWGSGATMGDETPTWPKWKSAAGALVRRVCADLCDARALHGEPADAHDEQCYKRVEELCKAAKAYISSPSWWRPGVPDAAFRAGHAADVDLVPALTDEQILRKIPEVLALAAAYIPADDWRRVAFEKRWPRAADPTSTAAPLSAISPADRVQLATTLQAGYDFLDLAQLKVRQFRNVLVGIVITLVVLLGGLTLTGWISPGAVPMCGQGPSTTSSAPQSGTAATSPAAGSTTTQQTCATGDDDPRGGDVALVALLGVIGGTLASALSLSEMGGAANTRYSLAVWQAGVKVLFGGAAAVLGILLIRAGLSSVLRLDGQVQILAFAVIFGYSQQLLTRLIDKEATALTSDASPATSAPAEGGAAQSA